MKRAHIYISGRVQGVLFRDSMRRKANQLGLKGWVRNTKDNQVEAILEGERRGVERLIEWSRKGPFLSRVDNVDLKWEKYQGEFNNFNLK